MNVDAGQILAQLAEQQAAVRAQQETGRIALENVTVALQNVVAAQGNIVQAQANRQPPNAASFVKPPKYNGDPDSTNWTTFRTQFLSYANLRWGEDPNDDQVNEQKTIAYLSIGKSAARLLTGLAPGSEAFQGAATLTDYLALLTDTFRPTSEVTLARQRFRQRKQDSRESVQVYANSKLELYEHAFAAEFARGEVTTLINEYAD